ncbi:MAG: FAD-linked oxidase C-terminal domain-containing protein [Solirubrobacterales bacterium]
MPASGLLTGLSEIVGAEFALAGDDPAASPALRDATESRGVSGSAQAVARPGSPAEVAELMRWCLERGLPLTARGGGTGLAGGAVPDGGVVVELDRLDRIRSFQPGLWRIEAEAGIRTARLARVARESGLLFPPDPGASEQSTVGGNIATNAGGPHAFKYGTTGAWVTGLEVVIPPGEVIRLGGPIRKDVSGYDLRHLLVGSEGTLGIVTSAWLRLVPAPESVLGVAAFYESLDDGCAAVGGVLEAGITAAALEFLDSGALALSLGSFPAEAPEEAGFLVLAEADGSAGEAERIAAELAATLGEGAAGVHRFSGAAASRELWRWRDGVPLAVAAKRGGKLSEDIVVPPERLAEAIRAIGGIGERHGLEACSWGHAGDGNLHATLLIDPADASQLSRAEAAAGELLDLALELGGSISGEHGVGTAKASHMAGGMSPGELRLHAAIKACFDPDGLLNPGKKTPGPGEPPPGPGNVPQGRGDAPPGPGGAGPAGSR